MVLFPNAINTREFSIIASTASSNSEGGKNTAFFSSWNFSSHPSIAVASQSEKEKTSMNNTHLHPCPDSFNPGTQRNSLLRLTSGLRQERGLSISPWLPSSTPWRPLPPRHEGKAIRQGASSLQHCWSYCLFYRTPVGRAGALSVGFLGTWLSVSEVHPAPASWNLQRAWLPAFLACATIREKKKKNP